MTRREKRKVMRRVMWAHRWTYATLVLLAALVGIGLNLAAGALLGFLDEQVLRWVQLALSLLTLGVAIQWFMDRYVTPEIERVERSRARAAGP